MTTIIDSKHSSDETRKKSDDAHKEKIKPGHPDASNSISFVATTNNVTTEHVRVRNPLDLKSLFFENKTFNEAFNPSPDSRVKESTTMKTKPVIIQASQQKASGEEDSVSLKNARWGLVSTIVDAYNGHHELVLRPDDVWQAILTQFSFYVNANAEELRRRFVDFEGKKTLVVDMGGTLFTADYASFASKMVDTCVKSAIKDPDIVDWLLPSFTTSTQNDKVTASITIMATLQAYFEYECCLCCGIPKVTLLGTVEDWEILRNKIDRLLEFDLKEGYMTRWHGLLVPILDQFVASRKGDANVPDFWDKVCHHEGGGSGPSYLCGWIVAFSVFSFKGQWHVSEHGGLCIDMDKLPVGTVAVPVLVDDNGTEYECQMVVGQLSSELLPGGKGLKARSDWCIAYPGHAKEDV